MDNNKSYEALKGLTDEDLLNELDVRKTLRVVNTLTESAHTIKEGASNDY